MRAFGRKRRLPKYLKDYFLLGTIKKSTNGLSNGIEQLNATIKQLRKSLEEESVRANHLEGLVSAMEFQSEVKVRTKGEITDLKSELAASQSEVKVKLEEIQALKESLREEREFQSEVEVRTKVEITDLKSQLAASQSEVKVKLEEIRAIKESLREERETVQQKDIEISRLNRNVQFIEEEIERSRDIPGLEAELNTLRNKIKRQAEDLEITCSDNMKLTSELQQMQIRYSELKKMRGRGEELELLEAQRDVVEITPLQPPWKTWSWEAAVKYWQQVLADVNTLQQQNNSLIIENSKLLECNQNLTSIITNLRFLRHVETTAKTVVQRPRLKAHSVNCPHCEKIIKYRHNLETHIENQHGQRRQRKQCSICFSTFKNSGSLRAHLSKKHSKGIIKASQHDHIIEKEILDYVRKSSQDLPV